MIQERVVIITGGTRGIGLATARWFQEHGDQVVIFGSRGETVERALNGLNGGADDLDGGAEMAGRKEKHYSPGDIMKKRKVVGFWPNLGKLAEIQEAVKEIFGQFGRIDVLINNAGISAEKPLEETSEEEFEAIMRLNVGAAWRMCKAVVPYMKGGAGDDESGVANGVRVGAGRGGVILNTSSMVSFYGQATGVGYPTSKFAINGLTKSLARELAPAGIRVNAVAPGVTNTDMVARLPEEAVGPLIQTIPLGRMGEPEDIAQAFGWLASDEAAYISGAVLPVDGLARS